MKYANIFIVSYPSIASELLNYKIPGITAAAVINKIIANRRFLRPLLNNGRFIKIDLLYNYL
jgi:hypothetical protein